MNEDNEKTTISFTKIIIIVLGFIALLNLRKIFGAMDPIFEWFKESLYGLYDFPEGAQTAIAFLSIVLIVVLIVKRPGRKNDNKK